MTPLLIILFGIHPATAVGTDLLYAASTKTVGALVHAAARSVDWKLVGLLAIGSVPATIATIVMLSQFNLQSASAEHAVTSTLGAVLVVTAVFLVLGRKIHDRYADRLQSLDGRKIGLVTILLGLVMGVLVTTTSVGAGAIGVTVLL